MTDFHRHLLLTARRRIKVSVNAPRRIALLVLLTGLSGFQHQAQARVFQRIGRFSAAETFKTAGGTLAYQADITVNGGKGRLTVAGFPSSTDGVLRQLRSFFNTTELPASGSGLIQATLHQGKDVTRLMIFQLAGSAQTLAIAIEQSESDYEASMEPPGRHLQQNMPAFPSSTPRFFVHDDEALMSLAVADTVASGASAASYFNAELVRDGWQSITPERSEAHLQMFMRGQEVCCVYVAPNPSPEDGSIIAVLHKQRRVK